MTDPRQHAAEGQAAGVEFDGPTTAIMPEHEVTRLHLVRHGQVERHRERIVGGQLDLVLSQQGTIEARGDHRTLVSRPGWYRETWEQQQRVAALQGNDLGGEA